MNNPWLVALEVRCADLAECPFERNAFDLVHAALVLECVDWTRVLPRGLHLESRRTERLESSKAFDVLRFRLARRSPREGGSSIQR